DRTAVVYGSAYTGNGIADYLVIIVVGMVNTELQAQRYALIYSDIIAVRCSYLPLEVQYIDTVVCVCNAVRINIYSSRSSAEYKEIACKHTLGPYSVLHILPRRYR